MATLNITPAAAQQIRHVLDERGQGLGLRVSVKPSGCSGYSYVLDFADTVSDEEVHFEAHGASVYVAPMRSRCSTAAKWITLAKG